MGVRIVGVSARKMDFQELANIYDESVDLIHYVHHLFMDLLPEDEEDDYPSKPASLAKNRIRELQKQINPNASDADFETQYHLVDMESKGALTFDEALEVVGLEDLPEEIRTSAATFAHEENN